MAALTNVGFRDGEHEASRPCRIVSYALGRAVCPRAVSARTCSPITLKVHRETLPADGRQAFQRLLMKCVPEREFSKVVNALLNSHASRTTGAAKACVLLMSGSLGE